MPVVLNPDDWGVDNSQIFTWRQLLKLKLLEKRKFKSDWSGKIITCGCDLHEGILTRANVPKSIWWQYKIFHEYNCFLLLPHEHTPQPPSREWAIQKAYAYYGRDVVRDWYYSLPFKVFPFQLPS